MPERTSPVVQWDPALPPWRAKVWSLVWELDNTCPVAWPTKYTCPRENRRWGREDGKHETALSGSFTVTEVEKRSNNWKNVRSSQDFLSWLAKMRDIKVCSLCYGIYPVWSTIQCSRGRGVFAKGTLHLILIERGWDPGPRSRRWV